MTILREWFDPERKEERAKLYRCIDPRTICVMNERLYFRHFGAVADYEIPITHETSIFMHGDVIKEEMKHYTWDGDLGASRYQLRTES